MAPDSPVGGVSLQRRLIGSVCVVLGVSLVAGAMLTYVHAISKVRTETQAALAVGRRLVQNAVDDSAEQTDPARRLARIVGDFNGDRHLRAILRDPAGDLIMQSVLQPPEVPAPAFFFRLVGGSKVTAPVELPPALSARGKLDLETDAHNEVAEAWGDAELGLSILGIFFCLVLGLTATTLRAALRPLQELCAALTRIGAGDYGIRLAGGNTTEVAAVQTGFNVMAERLAGMELQNRLLQTRVQRIQEEERGELARDLHDEIAPFLFAVSADASLIRQGVSARNLEGISARAGGILTSVNHMQKHLRHVLSRLMPDVLLDLGLSGAIETLVHFWQSRRPDIVFTVNVDADLLDDRRACVAFRVVQESLSNAVRHAHPTRIDIRVQQTGSSCRIEVIDNGTGMPQGHVSKGLGLLGMRERVAAIGGRFHMEAGPGGTGIAVHAELVSAREAVAPL
jgi:two-component system sensor histidine kinase UhpB